MELSYYSSTLKIGTQNYKPSLRKSSNFRVKCASALMSPSLGFNYNNSKNISSKHYKLRSTPDCFETESDPTSTKGERNFGAFWRLLRFHTINGVVITSTCLFVRALIETPSVIEWSLVVKALSGLFSLVCANIYTTIINQIYDVDIDKINKPYLPIAAGDISIELAWLLCAFFAAAGLSVVGFTCAPFITCLYGLALLWATIYSAPPLRLKNSPILTIPTMALVFGIVFNFGVDYPLRATLGLPFQWSPPLIFITISATIMTVVMSITKDLSDTEGDIRFGVRTLAAKLGHAKTAYLGFGLMLFYYVATVLWAVFMPQALKVSVIIPAHLISVLGLIYEVRFLEIRKYLS